MLLLAVITIIHGSEHFMEIRVIVTKIPLSSYWIGSYQSSSNRINITFWYLSLIMKFVCAFTLLVIIINMWNDMKRVLLVRPMNIVWFINLFEYSLAGVPWECDRHGEPVDRSASGYTLWRHAWRGNTSCVNVPRWTLSRAAVCLMIDAARVVWGEGNALPGTGRQSVCGSRRRHRARAAVEGSLMPALTYKGRWGSAGRGQSKPAEPDKADAESLCLA